MKKRYKLSLSYDFDFCYIAAKEIIDYSSDSELKEFSEAEWKELAAQRVDIWFDYGKCDIEEAIFYENYRDDMIETVTNRVLQLIQDWKDSEGRIEEIK